MNTNAPQAIECPVCDWLENLEGDDWNVGADGKLTHPAD